MSGLEVVAAVSAVVSAFHGGSELLKLIRAKRHKARQGRQELEEEQLKESLESGEQQIAHRYDQDMKQFGDLMRVGDALARNRLQHITIMMQGEVIKSLQMAAQYENAVINMTLLHEASIMNRKDTIVTLDELKQRLLLRMPINRQLDASSEPSSSSQLFLATNHIGGRSNITPASPTQSDYIPVAVHLPPQQDTEHSLREVDDHCRSRMNSAAAYQSRHLSQSTDMYHNQAYLHIMKERGASPEMMNQEIDEIMDSYQGLYITQRPNDAWNDNAAYSRSYVARHDSATDPYAQDSLSPTRENVRVPQNLPPTLEEHSTRSHPQGTAFNNGNFNHYQKQPIYQQYPARNPYPQMQMRTQANDCRTSTSSATSSAYSEAPSLGRNSSTSSQESHIQNQPSPLTQFSKDLRKPLSPAAPHAYHDNHYAAQTSSSPSHATKPESYPHSHSPQQPRDHSSPSPTSPQYHFSTNQTTAPFSDANSLMYSPFAQSYPQFQSHPDASFSLPHQRAHIAPDHDAQNNISRTPQYHLWPAVARNTPSTHSATSERTMTQPDSSATTPDTPSTIANLRHTSIAPSIASTDSSTSAPLGLLPGSRISKILRTETIESGPAGSEKMTHGRPCKANNYWGFCKGSWSIRGDQKEGLALRVQLSGMYNSREVWECCECSFGGSVFSTPHPTKKGKRTKTVDPRIQISGSGVRYKWIFLAKSHVRKKSTDAQNVESNYGCIICSLEDKVSSIYGGIETLMNHIALSHVADLSENTRRKARCIIGRIAGPNDVEWDINIPVFAQVELA